MQITLLAVGKLKEAYWRQALAEYQKRLSAYCQLQIIELADEKIPEKGHAAELARVQSVEGARLLAALPKDCYHIALDGRGKSLSSEGLAAKMAELALGGQSRLAFSIGGSLGLSEQVRHQADLLLSFGRMTFPHQLIRLMLLEQVYRAYRINRGEPYHK